MVSIFDLESRACAICSAPCLSNQNEDGSDKHQFIAGTMNAGSENKILLLEYDEKSKSTTSLRTSFFPEKVDHLSSSCSDTNAVLGAAFSSSVGIYKLPFSADSLICSVDTKCNQILWRGEESLKSCILVSKKSISSLVIDDPKSGSVVPYYNLDSDQEISYVSLDPFHSSTCLCACNKALSLVDFRSPRSILQCSDSLHGFGSITSVEYSSITPYRFLTSGTDGTTRVHDIRMSKTCSLHTLCSIGDHEHIVNKSVFNPFHDELFLSCSSDQTLRLFQLEKNGYYQPVQALKEFQDSVLNICWSSSSPWIFAGISFTGKVVIDSIVHEKKMEILLNED